ncbi:MAG TPA: DUF4304 domain-containing protein, partial [Micromonosporaceae bacterium]|nr:DUF4304 domain-containing protein [Micromonosporaceae bacterium]
NRVVSDYLAPVLKETGFRRRGRVFRRFAENCDAVVVRVQTSSGTWPGEAEFYVNVALVPVPWLEWMRKPGNPADLVDPDDAEGVLSARVTRPNSGLFLNDSWLCKPDEVDECGPVVAAATKKLVSEYLPLLDRHEFLRRLETKSPLPGVCPERAVQTILYLDGQRWADARRVIDDIAAYQPDSPFVAWVHARLSAT